MRFFTTLLATAVAISFAAIPADAGFQRIKKYENFKLIIGKRLYDDAGNWMRLNVNGTLSGKVKTLGKVSGKWSLDHGSFCRTMKVGSTTDSDCLWVSIDGKRVRLVRGKGTGKSQVLHMK